MYKLVKLQKCLYCSAIERCCSVIDGTVRRSILIVQLSNFSVSERLRLRMMSQEFLQGYIDVLKENEEFTTPLVWDEPAGDPEDPSEVDPQPPSTSTTTDVQPPSTTTTTTEEEEVHSPSPKRRRSSRVAGKKAPKKKPPLHLKHGNRKRRIGEKVVQ